MEMLGIPRTKMRNPSSFIEKKHVLSDVIRFLETTTAERLAALAEDMREYALDRLSFRSDPSSVEQSRAGLRAVRFLAGERSLSSVDNREMTSRE